MNKKIYILIVLILVISTSAYFYFKKPYSPSYRLIDSVVGEMSLEDVNILPASISWNLGRYQTVDGKMMTLARPGYSFEYSGSRDISLDFIDQLKKIGFEQNLNYPVYSTSTPYNVVGYTDGKIGCVIRRDTSEKDMNINIGCADDITFKSKNANSTISTTTVSQ